MHRHTVSYVAFEFMEPRCDLGNSLIAIQVANQSHMDITATAPIDPLVIGDEIRKARQKAGLSQEGLAFSAGINRTYVSMVETGRRNPTILVLNDLARAGLGTSVDRLLKKIR